jgi:aminopeptidase N
MSAISLGSETDSKDNSKIVYRFEQKVPIPSYLIAIVGGIISMEYVRKFSPYIK